MGQGRRSEEHTSELQSPCNLVCRLLLEKKNKHAKLPSARPQATAAQCCSLPMRCCLSNRVNSASTWQPSPRPPHCVVLFFFFFNDTAPTEISPLPLPDALPICSLTRPASASSNTSKKPCRKMSGRATL